MKVRDWLIVALTIFVASAYHFVSKHEWADFWLWLNGFSFCYVLLATIKLSKK